MRRKTSLSECSERFCGEADGQKLDNFLQAVEIFKKVKNISDDEALIELPLLFKDFAIRWWKGIKNEATTWKRAIELLKKQFAPNRKAHIIFQKIFDSKQKRGEAADIFISEKRALIAELPYAKFSDEMALDMVYSLLVENIRKDVRREQFSSFEELLTLCRDWEQLSINTRPTHIEEPSLKQKPRCNHCNYRGHKTEDCRKKKASEVQAQKTVPRDEVKPPIVCFGCGTTGFYRGNCPKIAERHLPVSHSLRYKVFRPRQKEVYQLFHF